MTAMEREFATSRTDDERAARNALAARAAALVLGVVVFWPIVAGLVAGLEYALLDIRGGVVPSFAVRATLTVCEALVGLFVLVVVVRLGSSEPRVGSQRRTGSLWLALVGLAVASAVGAAASVWYPFKASEAIAAGLGYARLAEWAHETASLAVLELALRTVAAIAGLMYSAARWQSARGHAAARVGATPGELR